MSAVDSTKSLHGYTVANPAGESLGTIEDFLLEADLRRVRYAVVSFRVFPALTHKRFAVPLQDLTLDTENECFIVEIDKARLADAPDFHDWLHADDRQVQDAVYRYHGVDASGRGAP
jgi:sporulation protein YlmC with PRC-barrel domain